MGDYLTHEPKRRWARHSNGISGDKMWMESDLSSANMTTTHLNIDLVVTNRCVTTRADSIISSAEMAAPTT